MCWYKTSADVTSDVKTCMKRYELEAGKTFGWSVNYIDLPNIFSDEHFHGHFCESGFAIQVTPTLAQCVETVAIKFKGNILEDPYECDPTDTTYKCEIHHSGSSFIEVPCECSLDGNTGYCASIIGT